jgi:hypothetical protein
MANIIVKDDKIEAIIDWESSGYYPWWAERWTSIMGSDATYGLFDALWEDFDPEMDTETFQSQVFLPLGKLKSAWGMAKRETDHPGHATELYRPPFCECKPYAGSFNLLSLGQPEEHKLREKKPPPAEKMKLQNDVF